MRTAAREPPMLVADAIPHGLPQVGRERLPTGKIERIWLAERPDNSVLNEVGRVCGSASPEGKPTVRPAPEIREAASDETPEGGGIAGVDAREQP
jgi:hypothetical protein